MKKLINVLMAMLIVGLFSLPAMAQTQVPVPNGDFELWNDNGASGPPDDWTIDNSPNVTCAQEATIKHGGSYSTNLTWTSTTNQYLLSDYIPCTGGRIYTIRAWFYDNDIHGRVRAYYKWYNSTQTTVWNTYQNTYSSNSTEWQEYIYTWTAADTAAYLRIGIVMYDSLTPFTSATNYVDDVTLSYPTANVPPTISAVYYYPSTAFPTDDINIRATITDGDGTIAYDTLWLQTTALTYNYVMNDSIRGSYYWYNVGTNPVGTLVEYYVVAVDDDGASTTSDTSSYTVANPPPLQTIAVTQFNNSDPGPAGSCYPAPDVGNIVTLSGVVSAIKANDPTYHRFYFQDADSLWSGMFVFGPSEAVALGDSIVATGPIAEYQAVTEWNGPTITYHGTGTVHTPLVVTSDDLSPACNVTAESYESMLIRLEDVLCVVGTVSGTAWVKSDANDDSCAIDDFVYGTSMPAFIQGQRYNIIGVASYYNYTMVYPRFESDIELIQAEAPLIANVTQYPPSSVQPTDIVYVSADITDDGTITADNLYLETIPADFSPVDHDSIVGDTYWYTIGANAEGTVVNYYISATDDDATTTTTDTYTYTVSTYIPTCANEISAIQTTIDPGIPPDCYPSPLNNQAVDVCGIITGLKLDATGSGSEAKFFMQKAGGGTWEGIYVYQEPSTTPVPLNNGDEIEIFASVAEYNGLTELTNFTDIHVLSTGNEPPTPLNVKVSDFVTDCSFVTEPYEGVLVKLKAVTVSSIGPGSGTWWVKDTTSVDSVLMTDYLYYLYADCAPGPAVAIGAVYDSLFGCMYWYGNATTPEAGYWRIYPRCGSDLYISVVPPPVITAVFPVDRDNLCILFNRELSSGSIPTASYTLSGGLTYSNPRIDPNNAEKVLLTVAMAPANDGVAETIDVSGIRDINNILMDPATVGFRQGFTPISQIQFASVPGDSNWWPSDMFGEVVTVRAFVTSDSTAYHRTNWFISDTHTEMNGVCLYIYDGIPHPWVPALGDTLVVTGRVDEYYGETEVNTDYAWLYDNMYLISDAGADPEPMYMGTTTAEYIYNTTSAASEAIEGVLCKLCDSLTVLADANGASPYQHFIGSLTTEDTLCLEGQGTMRNYTPPTIGTRIDGMTGIDRWRRGLRRLIPRSEADFNTGYTCGPTEGYAYLPGDANMYIGIWPPTVINSDVTYLVNFFRNLPANPFCKLDGLYCAADVNGDCRVIGSDVTRLVSFFRGIAIIEFCPDYEPLWHNSGELPPSAPSGWPNCESVILSTKLVHPSPGITK